VGERMHFKDTTDPIEIQSPGGDCLFIILRAELSKHRKLVTPLDDVPLDLDRSPAIVGLVSGLFGVRAAALTHVVNCSIASRVSWLSRSPCLPLTPW
jgi:hypothetical protein